MECSKCNKNDYSSFGGYKIKIEKLGPKIEDALYRPFKHSHSESEPYLILCQDCFNQMFQRCKIKKDVTSIQTKEVTGNI